MSSRRHSYVLHHDLVNRYGESASLMTTDICSVCLYSQVSPSSLKFNSGFAQALVFSVMLLRSLLVLSLSAIVLSMLLRHAGSDYPFGIFEFIFDICILVQTWLVFLSIPLCITLYLNACGLSVFLQQSLYYTYGNFSFINMKYIMYKVQDSNIFV